MIYLLLFNYFLAAQLFLCCCSVVFLFFKLFLRCCSVVFSYFLIFNSQGRARNIFLKLDNTDVMRKTFNGMLIAFHSRRDPRDVTTFAIQFVSTCTLKRYVVSTSIQIWTCWNPKVKKRKAKRNKLVLGRKNRHSFVNEVINRRICS